MWIHCSALILAAVCVAPVPRDEGTVFGYVVVGMGDVTGDGVGDFDGDGHDEIIVGMTQANSPGLAGHVRIYSGKTGKILREHKYSDL